MGNKEKYLCTQAYKESVRVKPDFYPNSIFSSTLLKSSIFPQFGMGNSAATFHSCKRDQFLKLLLPPVSCQDPLMKMRDGTCLKHVPQLIAIRNLVIKLVFVLLIKIMKAPDL